LLAERRPFDIGRIVYEGEETLADHTLDDGSPVRPLHGTGGDIESVSVNAATLAHAVTFHLEEARHPAGITYDGDSRDYDPTDVTDPMNLAGGMTAGGPTL